jgi:two-component system nitrate/nitrite response regulator NarL
LKTSLLLVGDQGLCRAGLRALLDASDAVELVGETASGLDAIPMCGRLDPAVILIDLIVPEPKFVETIRALHDAKPRTRILVLARQTSRQFIFEALQAGAAGLVAMKWAAAAELLTAIDAVVAKGSYLSPALAEMTIGDYFRRSQKKNGASGVGELEMLGAREREVLKLIAEGNSSKKIAQALSISARTVDAHRYRIMNKLNIYSIAGLTRFAIRHDLCQL